MLQASDFKVEEPGQTPPFIPFHRNDPYQQSSNDCVDIVTTGGSTNKIVGRGSHRTGDSHRIIRASFNG
jgi:hypothetical protein